MIRDSLQTVAVRERGERFAVASSNVSGAVAYVRHPHGPLAPLRLSEVNEVHGVIVARISHAVY